MTVPTGRSRNAGSRSAIRVRSPVVSTPARRPFSTTRASPRSCARLATACRMVAAGASTWPGWTITSRTRSSSFRPSEPPGCSAAKSSRRKPFTWSSATASASPSASATVVLVVGARSWGHASSATAPSSATAATRASVDCMAPVMR
jgi:hypothetical protein